MLTSDLICATRRKGRLHIRQLRSHERELLQDIAAMYIDILHEHVGKTRGEIEEAWGRIPYAHQQHKYAKGLQKLLIDRGEFDNTQASDTLSLREEVFLQAVHTRKNLAMGSIFDRNHVLQSVAQNRQTTIETIETNLFADLRSAQRLMTWQEISAAEFISVYEHAQKQAVLLKATHVVLTFRCLHPAEVRYVFQQLKFYRLLYQIETVSHDTYRITIDGPFRLFQSATKYGVQFAAFFQILSALSEWQLEAHVLWGQNKDVVIFCDEGKKTQAIPPKSDPLLSEVQLLCAQFEKNASVWTCQTSSDILPMPGMNICVPDLLFTHKDTLVKIYCEIMGYWSREAVWKRVEWIKNGSIHPILFAVGSHLRVSEKVLQEHDMGRLCVYQRTLTMHQLEATLNALHLTLISP